MRSPFGPLEGVNTLIHLVVTACASMSRTAAQTLHELVFGDPRAPPLRAAARTPWAEHVPGWRRRRVADRTHLVAALSQFR
jgi:hypothetical protein